ncbi:H+-transporting ATPase related protein [Ferroplasma acidiphilum]|jgi:H+-transporting ATPase|uniref:H+-transporting ATPase related protein n=2 Tax=Ferroplasma acidiphilum TaxID=74969 RepID=A0A1V0N2N7_9ARCH|nr:plasma-membrane proton-efflux P-type ATPase [Ferroplasma acidiphilum]ARD84412.1 H+-transporting ATPase related protein [Ferroplasma acidiphilum]
MIKSSDSLEDLFKKLNTSKAGLSGNEASSRLHTYGYNEVSEKKESSILKFLKKFWTPISWMLELTIIITFILGKYDDSLIILFLLIFNGVISFTQESKADNAVELLKKKLSAQARVLRDGKWNVIETKFLVPGDIVHLRLGDVVPADIKIIDDELEIDQSALTGESLSVTRKKGDTIYSSSVVKRGECNGLVTETGSKTYFGKTTELVEIAKTKSHIEELIMKIIKDLIAIDTILVIALILFSIYRGVDITEVIPFALVILIASIPVALPATFTIAMSLGALHMSKRGEIVTRLSAIEDAASMDTLCMDKTGTITENKLTIKTPKVYTGDELSLIKYASYASQRKSEDPIDDAILDYADLKSVKIDYANRSKFTPFDPSIKRTEAIINEAGKSVKIVKGAPQVISELTGNVPETYENDIKYFSSQGFRIISVAAGTDKLEILGVIPLYDPPRKDSRDLITELKQLSVSPVMITGDNSLIAEEVAGEIGLDKKLCNAENIKGNYAGASDCSVFAEVFPEDKYYIVKALQKSGHIVGMTGDGVNDSPALKQAEFGVAVASATDVAKASASVVLTHSGLTDIVDGIKSGRRIYQRMLTYTLNKIIKVIQIVFFLTLSFFVVGFFVTTAFDVILLIFANDFVTMAIATDNVGYSIKPERWNVNSLISSSVILSAFLVVESFIFLYIGLYAGLRISQIHTFIFDMLVFSGQFTVYMVRERKRFFNSMPSKILLLSSIVDIIIISFISYYGILVTAIPLKFILISIGLTFIWMVFMDTIKNVVFRHYKL